MQTMGELIERNACYYPNREALIYDCKRITYGQFASRVRRLADALFKLSLRRQERIAILAMNCSEYFEVYGAGEWAGYMVVTVNFRLAPPEILHVLKDSGSKMMVFESQYGGLVDSLRPQLPQISVFMCIGPECPDWATPYEQLLGSGAEQGPPIRSRPDDLGFLIYTSGTTGRPKGVARTQRSICAIADSCAADSEFTGDSRVLLNTPAFHSGAKGYHLAASWRGATAVLQRSFIPLETLKAIQNERITFTFMVAAMLQAVLDVADAGAFDLSSLRTIVTAAAPVPVPLLKRGIERLGRVFAQAYGMTEGAGTILHRYEMNPYGSPDDIRRLASVGRPNPKLKLRIVDDMDQDCPAGTRGEVITQSATCMTSYWNNSPATIEALRDGWYHTGDIGYVDDEGYLFLVDRKKDMIISGGENIYSREVEEALLSHPDVVDAAVIGIPDIKWGEAVKAIVVARAGTAPTEAAVIAHCKALIAGYKCPKTVAFIDELPRVASGKVNKVALRNSRDDTHNTTR
jgi:acyl-CoA synthetase (AMP-forming)/AMP-acid ligase II